MLTVPAYARSLLKTLLYSYWKATSSCLHTCLFPSSHSTNLSPVVHAFVVCMCVCVWGMHNKIGISLCLCKCSGLLWGEAPELIHLYIIIVKQELDCILHKPLPLHVSDSQGYYILHNSNIQIFFLICVMFQLKTWILVTSQLKETLGHTTYVNRDTTYFSVGCQSGGMLTWKWTKR